MGFEFGVKIGGDGIHIAYQYYKAECGMELARMQGRMQA